MNRQCMTHHTHTVVVVDMTLKGGDVKEEQEGTGYMCAMSSNPKVSN